MFTGGKTKFLRELNAEQKRIALAGAPYLGGYVLLTATPYSYIDLYHWDEYAPYAWMAFFSWALGYLLLLLLMNDRGLFAGGKASGVGVYFGLSIVVGIFVGLALVALIVPGLYLLMRWLPVYARALTSDVWMSQSMRWSWTATEEFQKPLAVASLGPLLCFGVAIVAASIFEVTPSVGYMPSTIILNLGTSAGMAWLTVLGVAAFVLLSHEHRRGLEKSA